MPLVSLLFHDVFRSDPAESGYAGAVANRYKLQLEHFDAMLAAIAEGGAPAPIRVPAEVEAGQSAMALTFDDGGESYHTLIADRLEARGWRGHCFMSTGRIGQQGFLSEAQLRDLDERGHVIGTHSATHPNRFSACRPEQMVEEWTVSRKRLEDLLGHAVSVGSLPGGYFSHAVAQSAADAGLSWLFTSEPETRERQVGACRFGGRFTIRRGQAAQFAADILAGRARARQREWWQWKAKKVVKPVLGPLYPVLGELLGSIGRHGGIK